MKTSKKHIIFVHLLNDFSGSPLVLSQVVGSLPSVDYSKTIITTKSSTEGFLNNIEETHYKYYWYKWKSNPWYRLITYSISQFFVFFKILIYWNKPIVIYINTLLPFGAAWAGKLLRKKVIYHIHETSINPPILKYFLKWTANNTASKAAFVSDYLMKKECLTKVNNVKIYNCLSPKFTNEADNFLKQEPIKTVFVVLMICSLKNYKGVNEYIKLAHKLNSIQFELVLNCSIDELDEFISKTQLTNNITIYETQKNVHPFFQKASLILNLSHPDKWVETFGMTILEGMYYGLPAIVPELGGITELVKNGVNGYCISVFNLSQIEEKINEMYTNKELYHGFSSESKKLATEFTHSSFSLQIQNFIES